MQAENPDAVIVDDSGLSAGRALMSVVSAAHEQLVILTVEGSIDVLTAPQLSDAVSQALSGQPDGLIIDLTTTEFLARAIADRLADRIGAGKLGGNAGGLTGVTVTLHESHVAWASYERDL